MYKGRAALALILMIGQLSSILMASSSPYDSIQTVDPDASRETKALFANLRALAPERTLFGQQDALAYGVHWKEWHQWRSDVSDVSGRFPAVFGWDLSKLGQDRYNIDTVSFKQIQNWMQEVYRQGGINTLSWHFDNFVTGGDSWDCGERVVAAILPGGSHHQAYRDKLDLFADFVKELRVGFIFKKDIPIIFRPFHEHTGNWFWWGKNYCTPEEYITLWRFTVEYLRDEKDMHNLLYAYSPDVFRDRDHYLECYPGDEYVDILGLDDYHDVGRHGRTKDLVKRLRIIVELAEERGKVAALTETGFERIPQADWWTERLLRAIQSDPVATRIAWLLVWRNAREDHHYGPYPGHPSAANFVEFSQDPSLIFQDNLNRIYHLK